MKGCDTYAKTFLRYVRRSRGDCSSFTLRYYSEFVGSWFRSMGGERMKHPYFAKIPLQALADKRLSHGSIRVLAALNFHCFKDKTICNPSVKRLMAETTMSDRGVKDALNLLQECGYLVKTQVLDTERPGRNKPNIYELKIPKVGEETSPWLGSFGVKKGEKTSYESEEVSETEEKNSCAERVFPSSLSERKKEYVPSDGFSFVNDEQETRTTLPPGGMTSMGSVVRDMDYMEDARRMRSGTPAQAFRNFIRLCESQDRERVQRALNELSKRTDIPRESVESILDDNGFRDLEMGVIRHAGEQVR